MPQSTLKQLRARFAKPHGQKVTPGQEEILRVVERKLQKVLEPFVGKPNDAETRAEIQQVLARHAVKLFDRRELKGLPEFGRDIVIEQDEGNSSVSITAKTDLGLEFMKWLDREDA